MQANQLRRAFVDFFTERGHTAVPSASLIPVDPTLLFTVAGMVPFKPYFLGEEVPPYKRAVTVQKCVRAGGKHNDLEEVGRTKRHLTFFEMLGNFSFGDYFKAEAIAWAWELFTEKLGLDAERLWVTVHVSDDDAERIWHEQVGVPMSRIQRLDKDNFWQMGDTGPCGPCSEIFWDKGPEHGADGGPAFGGDERFVEIWNLVFMQYDGQPDGTRIPLPKPSIDTGAGLERVLTVLQGVDSVWDIDEFVKLLDVAQSASGVVYGKDPNRDVSLRIFAEHARTMTFLVSDGVFPSNEGRGYVLRRIIRRAVRYAYLLGTEKLVMPSLVETAIGVMGNAYPDVVKNRDFITGVITREEERFRQTLKTGLGILEDELERLHEPPVLAGSVAFKLHDTYGFPLEVTKEITEERGIGVDTEGFEAEMAEQRRRAKGARKDTGVSESAREAYQEIVEQFGTTEFTGYAEDETEGRVLAVLPNAADDSLVEIFLDRTPFYAESGGQVGDTGRIESDSAHIIVYDAKSAAPGLTVHIASVEQGTLRVGDTVTARVDAEKRRRTRANHTATHLMHAALKEVLGPHVKQAGSLVAPDRLRFDFTHFAPLTDEETAEIERLVNREILVNTALAVEERGLEEALASGAVALFGEKYGDRVRVVSVPGFSTELCGGTHVRATGDIGLFKIVSDASIASGVRRIEALTADGALERLQQDESVLGALALRFKTSAHDVPAQVEQLAERLKRAERDLDSLRMKLASQQAGSAAESAREIAGIKVVAQRVDNLDANGMRQMADQLSQKIRSGVVVLGKAEDGKASLVVRVTDDLTGRLQAGKLVNEIAAVVGGKGGGKPDNAQGGGTDASKIKEAIMAARAAAMRVLH